MALLVVTPTVLKDLTTIVFRDVASRAGRAFLDSRSRVPAFPHSWRFRHVGPRERGTRRGNERTRARVTQRACRNGRPALHLLFLEM